MKLLHLPPGGFPCLGELLELPSTALAWWLLWPRPHRLSCVMTMSHSGPSVSREMAHGGGGGVSSILLFSSAAVLMDLYHGCRVFSSPGEGRAVPCLQLLLVALSAVLD